MSLNYLATRFTCSWPWTTATLLCDGRLVCGCADPYGKRVLGDARTTSVSDVWTGPTAAALRRDINAGGSKFCGDCPLNVYRLKGGRLRARLKVAPRARRSRHAAVVQ
ncbi:MAG: SPASM domain-containing protein [Vicinamibacterales bacterium]